MKRPIRCFIGIAMLAFSQSTPAAPFLVSDAYPADGPQPDGFVVTLSNSLGTKTVAVPAFKTRTGQRSSNLTWPGSTGRRSRSPPAQKAPG
ncbi:MAG: hypothetical protein IPI57_14475 [Candidatus Competibacteraceae bacterium]|nr:hypothetical protein [Candidatus Competibacteraceae bacterium]